MTETELPESSRAPEAPFRIRQLLLVASRYDAFMLEEDGRLSEMLARSYSQRLLPYVPEVVRAATAAEALQRLARDPVDLLVTMMRLEGSDPFTFAREAHALRPGLPVAILAYNTPPLQRMLAHGGNQVLERIFVWQGDGRILPAIIQLTEDARNIRADPGSASVPHILLAEDSPVHYSRLLPVLYEELAAWTSALMDEELSFPQRRARLLARPRIQLAVNYEEAQAAIAADPASLHGALLDLRLPRRGRQDAAAGVDLLRDLRARCPGLPVLVQSAEPEAAGLAREAGAVFLAKDDPGALAELRRRLPELLGFAGLQLDGGGAPSPTGIRDTAQLLAALDHAGPEAVAAAIADGSLARWLRARGQAGTACALPRGDADPRPEVRRLLLRQRHEANRGALLPYTRRFPFGHCRFSRIGSGSIGGKARGLTFLDRILAEGFCDDDFPGVTIDIPPSLIIASDVFDEFVRQNDLAGLASGDRSDEAVVAACLRASLPATVLGDLRDFLLHVQAPLAVRSSSLLEDSLYQPFAGIYATQMLANDQAEADARFLNLVNAIKFVYASTFFRRARAYLRQTPHRLTEEKMAVVIQPLVGRRHADRYYPDFSGVARSFDFYPVSGCRPEDGVVSVAVGLGKTVVDGGVALRFSPQRPGAVPQLSSARESLRLTQRDLFAVAMRRGAPPAFMQEDQYLMRASLADAEADGTLTFTASTYDRDSDTLVDGTASPGARVVSFAHVLKNRAFPLADLSRRLMETCSAAMNCPVEIEFAALLDPERALPAVFSLLQVRPLAPQQEFEAVRIEAGDRASALCYSSAVLGHGERRDIRDVLYVRPEAFRRDLTPAVAADIAACNRRLEEENRPSLLIGPGRWGSSEPWLGIPVRWEDVSAARAIIETPMPDMSVDPSQGSHFFQNITQLQVGYFSVGAERPGSFVDWPWLDAQPGAFETPLVRHVRLASPLTVRIDGRCGEGVVIKPAGGGPRG